MTIKQPHYTTTTTGGNLHIMTMIAPDTQHSDKLRESLLWHADGIRNALNLYARGTGNTTAALVARMIAACVALVKYRGQ